MSTTESLCKPLDESAAREAINRWSGEGYFRIRNFGDKLFLNESLGCEAFAIRLSTHCEERTVRRQSVPYSGGPVDDNGTPPDPWDIKVPQPAPFEEETKTLTVPHTEQVTTCSGCGGKGRTGCLQCQGRGRTTCNFCGGSGYRQMTSMVPQKDMKGNVSSMPQTTKQPCTCMGGMVTCLGCGGSGTRQCPTCSGSGQVKSFDQLTVRFHTPRQAEVIDATQVPDDTFLSLKGEVMIDEQAPRIDQARPVNSEVDGCVRKLLGNSHHVDAGQTRVLAQHLKVERIPVTEVKYSYAGVERKLWICGNERCVHAPDAPWHRHRLLWLILGIGLGVAAIIGLVVFFVSR